MKTHTLLRYFLTAANLAAALALLPPHARAEDKPPSRPKLPAPTASRSSAYDLEIEKGGIVKKGTKEMLGASLGNVLDVVRDRYPNANIVLSPGLENLQVGDLKLRSRNSLAEELEAISVASGGKFEFTSPGIVGPGAAPPIDPTTGLPLTITGPHSNDGLFILREPAPTPETARTVEAFNIGPYLQWLREKQDAKQAQESREKEIAARLDELEKIVSTTLKSLKQETSVELPSYQFHRGANLLIVTGTRDAVEVARKVVNALPGQAGFAIFGGGAGGSSGGSVPGMRLEDSRAFQERYGLRPTVPSPVPVAPPTPVPRR